MCSKILISLFVGHLPLLNAALIITSTHKWNNSRSQSSRGRYVGVQTPPPPPMTSQEGAEATPPPNMGGKIPQKSQFGTKFPQKYFPCIFLKTAQSMPLYHCIAINSTICQKSSLQTLFWNKKFCFPSMISPSSGSDTSQFKDWKDFYDFLD